MDGHGAPVADDVGAMLRHTAFFHQGATALAAWAAPTIAGALQRDEAVLACLSADAEALTRQHLGEVAERVNWLSADDRYARPGVAMSTVQGFAHDAVSTGSTCVWSIGTLPFHGSDRDRRWVRYEMAVHDVLAALPLHAVCTYDTHTTPPTLLDAARRSHDGFDGDEISGPPGQEPLADLVGAPARRPDVELVDGDPGGTRRGLRQVLAASVPARQLDDVLLVASELMTNALRHGAPPITTRAWIEHDTVVIEVADHGEGEIDPYADLRLLRGSADGGYGLWLVGQLADWVDIDTTPGHHAVRAAVGPSLG